MVDNPFRSSALLVYDEMQASPSVGESVLRLHLKNAHFSRLVFVARHREVEPIQLGH